MFASFQYNPTPEQELALTLLSQRPVSDSSALKAQLQSINWNRLLSLVPLSLHPFLHFVLDGEGMLDSISPEALALLDRAKTDAVIRYMRRKTEMERVLALFNVNGIEAVLLKGASLGESVYPLPYLRPMRDVDLWIPVAQMARAHSILKADGYREKHVPSLEFDLRGGKEIRLAKFFNYDLSVIEIHSTLDVHLPDEEHETDAIWSRRIDHPVLSGKTLHARDMLYHLCTHLALRHRFEQGLLWLLDIRLFLARYGLQVEWDKLAEESRRQHTCRYIYVSLTMAADLLECDVADAAFAMLEAPDDLPSMKSLAWRQIWYSNFAALPPRRFLMLATAGSPGKMITLFLHRLHKYSVSTSPDHQQPETFLQRVRSALQWIQGDLRKAYSAFRSGAFSRANLQRACEMELRRTEFEKGMQA